MRRKGESISTAMDTGLIILVLFSLSTLISSVPVEPDKTTSLPCSPKEGSDGYVCVCNSTYCDTIVAPTKIKSGKYYHYYTSDTTPGFNMKKGSFGTKKTSESSVTVTVDSSTTYQTYSGVGGGFSDSAAYVYSQLPSAARENLIKSYYGATGVEFTFARVPVGVTDFSLSDYTYDNTIDDVDMTNFNLTQFELNYKVPFIQAALDATSRTVNLLATPWTSPFWTKDNNESAPGFLIPEYHAAFANYIIKFLEQYKANGIEYWAVSPMNEPVFGIGVGFSMPNLMILPTQFRTLVRDYLGPKLKEAGLDGVKIVAMDDERPFLDWFARTLLSDDESAQYIDGFSLHWYSDDDSNTDVLDNFYAAHPDKFILYTESSGGDQNTVTSTGDNDISLGSWDGAEKYIANILQNYQHYSIGWMFWNLCLNLQGGPYMQMSQQSPILVDTSSGEFYKQPMYYGVGHLSKFIYPNSVRIGLTIVNSSSVELENVEKKKTTTTTTTTPAVPTGGPGPNPTGGSFTGGPGPNPTGGSFTGGPGPNPTGGSFTGGPGPGPNPTGGSFTGGPGPGPNPTGGPGPNPSSYNFDGVATTNPDGSKSVILFNPTEDSVTVAITDSNVGTITTTIEANSINTFVYW